MKPGITYIGITTPFYCNDGKGNFLIHKRSNNCRDEKGTWDLGAGELKFGQEVEDSVLREVREEYGVKGEIQEKLPAHSIIREENGIKTHWLAIPFFVKVDVTKAKIMEPEKIIELRVVRLDSLPEPLHKGLRESMSRYKEQFDRHRR